MRQPAHSVIYTDRAKAAVRWMHRGCEKSFRVDAGFVRFSPADDDEHVMIGRCNPWHRFFTLLIPRQHLIDVASSEGITAVPELRHSISPRDAVLTSCMRTLSHAPQHADQPADDAHEVAALTLILRLLTMNGSRVPDWTSDASVFGRRILNELVAYIDEHLRHAPSLVDIAELAGMSPGHFAKKFRQSTGLSFHRFVIQRRIRKSLLMLQEPFAQVSSVARDVGFSSQSHFTRLFRHLTGMTPAKYQNQFGRTVG